jgi:hypothetical protein
VTTASSTHQQAALNQLLATYTRDLSRGLPPHTISALGKQITTAAKVLGKYVTLPTAAATAAAPPVASVEPAVGKVNVTA